MSLISPGRSLWHQGCGGHHCDCGRKYCFFYSDRLCDADFGNMISVALALILEFFIFSVDYSKAEKFQYEDDEYYYYVKAIPKYPWQFRKSA